MSQITPRHVCLCSKCHGASKSFTKRTIEAHLRQDQSFLQTLSAHGDSAAFVQSCINQTLQLLSQIHGGPSLPGTAPDADGSHPDGLEGALLKFLTDT